MTRGVVCRNKRLSLIRYQADSGGMVATVRHANLLSVQRSHSLCFKLAFSKNASFDEQELMNDRFI